MRAIKIIILLIIMFIVGNKFDMIKNYVKSENERVQKIEFCRDVYMGRETLFNECMNK